MYQKKPKELMYHLYKGGDILSIKINGIGEMIGVNQFYKTFRTQVFLQVCLIMIIYNTM